MRHLIVRLQLTWLTFAAVVAGTMVTTLGPRGGGIDVHFALSSQQFRTALQRASADEAAGGLAADGISIKTVNTFRAGLAADMLFLVAYGLLLRKSVRYHPPHRWSRAAEWGAVFTMAADAIENVGTLTVLGTFATRDAQQPEWLMVVTAVAAIAKWTFAALVMLFLALRWHDRVSSFARPLRLVARLAALAFAAASAGALLVAVSALVPPIRKPAALVAVLAPAVALALQFRLLDTFGRLLRFAFLARVPLIVLVTIAAFGPVGLGPAASLLGGILDVPGAWGIAATTASCLVLAFACGTEVNMVRAYAWQRMFDPTLRVLQFRALASAVFWTAVVAAASLVFSMAVASADVSASAVVRGVVGGLAAALLFLVVVELIAAMLTERKPGRSIPQLAAPLDRIPLIGSWLRRVRRAPPPAALVALKKSVGRLSIAGRLFGVSSGYIGTDRRLLPGHSFAAVQLLISTAFYGLLVYAKWGSVAPANPWVPTAASIVLLLLLWSWALAGISFFLDRYRVPLFTSVIGLVLLSGSCKHTDHVVDLKPAADQALASPGEILSAFPRRPLVVAAAGGGIQAGAWAARALQGIDQALGRSAPAAFRDRLALVTGVSGGSMGAMFYGAYRDLDVVEGDRTVDGRKPGRRGVGVDRPGPAARVLDSREPWPWRGAGAQLGLTAAGGFEPGHAWCMGGQGEAVRARHNRRRTVSRLPVRHDHRRDRAGDGICDVTVSDEGISPGLRQGREAVAAGGERQPRLRSVEGRRDTQRTRGRRDRDSRQALGRVPLRQPGRDARNRRRLRDSTSSTAAITTTTAWSRRLSGWTTRSRR